MLDTRNPPITLTMNLSEVNEILEEMGELPFKRVADRIIRIRQQTQEQLQQIQMRTHAPEPVEHDPAAPRPRMNGGAPPPPE